MIWTNTRTLDLRMKSRTFYFSSLQSMSFLFDSFESNFLWSNVFLLMMISTYFRSSSPPSAQRLLQETLNAILTWSQNADLAFPVLKTSLAMFRQRNPIQNFFLPSRNISKCSCQMFKPSLLSEIHTGFLHNTFEEQIPSKIFPTLNWL